MKFIGISVIMIGLILLLNLGGIATPSTGYALRLFGVDNGTYISSISDYIEDDDSSAPLSNFKNDPKIWVILVGIFLVVSAVGVRAGLFGSAPPINYYLGVFISALGIFILTDMIAVITKLWEYGEGWMRAVLLLISVILSFIYLVSIISFWMGSDG